MSGRSDHSSGVMVNRTKQLVTRLGDVKNLRNGHKTRTATARATRALKVIEAVKRQVGRWR